MPLIATRGAASAQGFGEFAQSAAVNYIENVFSTWLYTGTSATQTITNNIDVSGKGAMVWVKARSNVTSNELYDTSRGASNRIFSDLTNSQSTNGDLNGFTSSGFSLGYVSGGANGSGDSYASWTFRKQPKFFDIVTWTGNGSYPRTISHSLGAVPGCIICKQTSLAGQWATYHTSLGNANAVYLNSTLASFASSFWNSTTPTDTGFTIGASFNATGETYVAYLFASNAGGFGLTGSNNVITCGSYTGNGTTNNITLGFEPQWLLVKRTDTTSDWRLGDIMRGSLTAAPGTAGTANLYPNLTSAEDSSNWWYATSTGFATFPSNGASYNASGGTYIYIAIRRGPMKTPTTGTSVYYAAATQDVNTSITPGFPVDLAIDRYRYQDNVNANQIGTSWVYDRLRGTNSILQTSSVAAEVTAASGPSFYVSTTGFQSNTKLNIGPGDGSLGNDNAQFWTFSRAPGFFDVVCYTGNATDRTVTHNLSAVPELYITKATSNNGSWEVYCSYITNPLDNFVRLNGTLAATASSGFWGVTAPTSTTFSLGIYGNNNASGYTYIAYLFATLAGISKVGTYTGTAALQTIACGFTTGARFILIKRTDSTGDWYVYDSSRGITSGNDPYLFWNSTAAQNSTTNYVDTDTTGFKVTAAASTTVNVSAATYIFLAIA